ncbi:MAG: hypothetical protein WC721_21490 [Victivallaceae bacterium]
MFTLALLGAHILDNHAHILDIAFADIGCPPWQPVPVLIPATTERGHPTRILDSLLPHFGQRAQRHGKIILDIFILGIF